MSNKTKKLLVVGGGRSIHTYNFISLVKDYFADVVLLTDYDNKDHTQIKKKIINFSFANPFNALRSVFAIKRFIQTLKPDFIVCYQVDTAAFMTMLCASRRIPSLIIAMGSDVLINTKRGLPYRLMIKYVLKRGKYFNAGSQPMIDAMQKISKRKIDVVLANLGINPIEPKAKQNIVFSNRLHTPLYRIEEIIKGFARFVNQNQRSDWQLVVAATGNEENLQRLAQSLGINGQIKFVGWLSKEENAHFYAISRLWISLPQSDSISISLMEAMSAECVPVVSDVAAVKGVITNGINGIIVSDFDNNFLEEALKIDNAALRSSNRSFALTFGSKDANRNKFYEIFDKEFRNESSQ
ncbi:MAG: glycosyltransferase family 4 protein [Bacteroidales bacterium]|jgi:glycosyltransferase involved in cell wall biosynthesis|nr:glycosyltransferase family 4 protein [Bacteroidales bacterium]